MPSLLNNPKPIRIVLDCDKHIEKDTPAFLIRPLTFGQSKNLSALMDSLDDAKSVGEMFDNLESVYNDCIVGVENIDATPAELIGNILTFPEIMELLGKVLRSGQVMPKEGN